MVVGTKENTPRDSVMDMANLSIPVDRSMKVGSSMGSTKDKASIIGLLAKGTLVLG